MSAIWALAALAASCRAANVERVPPVYAPLGPTRTVAVQLQLDLAARRAPDSLAALQLPATAVPATAQAWSELRRDVLAAPADAAGPAPGQAAAGSAAAAAEADERLRIAAGVLGSIPGEKFERLAPDELEDSLRRIFDGWRGSGVEPGLSREDRLRAFDGLIEQGVEDPKLTHSNKSIFLAVAVLNIDLEAAAWLTRTRFPQALEDNALDYPADQRWKTEDGTPEFLSPTKGGESQSRVDEWAHATRYARQLLRQVRLRSKRLPRDAKIAAAAGSAFAALLEELDRGGHEDALRLLTGDDPTLTAFLLDAGKPGYYRYNAKGAVVDKIFNAKAAAALGVRRLDHAEGDRVIASTYYYRPARVAQTLRRALASPAAAAEPELAAAMAPLSRRMDALAPRLDAPISPAPGYSFEKPELLAGVVLDGLRNRLANYTRVKPSFQRYDLPISLQTLRSLKKAGQKHGAVDQARWDALMKLYDRTPALHGAPPTTTIRLVSSPRDSAGLLIAPAQKGDTGIRINMFALDHLAALGDEREDFLAFARDAASAALADLPR